MNNLHIPPTTIVIRVSLTRCTVLQLSACLYRSNKLLGQKTIFKLLALYFDFEKAFDCVPHKQFLIDLQKSVFQGKLQTLIETLLSQRQLYVNVNEEIFEKSVF